VRRTVAALDPNIAVAEVSTLADAQRRSIAAPRFNALLLSVFAALALLLATVGIYGVLAYGVSQRSREIGVRMALGARRNDVITMVLREALVLVAAGLALGLIGALATTRFLGRLLFELNARDPATFAGVAALLGSVALVASLLPRGGPREFSLSPLCATESVAFGKMRVVADRLGTSPVPYIPMRSE
jgi:predicted lysophospholipase L1 biosynthesis ABC-type transport system permease subunit